MGIVSYRHIFSGSYLLAYLWYAPMDIKVQIVFSLSGEHFRKKNNSFTALNYTDDLTALFAPSLGFLSMCFDDVLLHGVGTG